MEFYAKIGFEKLQQNKVILNYERLTGRLCYRSIDVTRSIGLWGIDGVTAYTPCVWHLVTPSILYLYLRLASGISSGI